MRVTVLQTFVEPTAKGMIVGNTGDIMDTDTWPGGLADKLVGEHKIALDAPVAAAVAAALDSGIIVGLGGETVDFLTAPASDDVPPVGDFDTPAAAAALAAEELAMAERLIADSVAPLRGEDGQPVALPAGDIAAAIASPDTIAHADGVVPAPLSQGAAAASEPPAAFTAPAPVKNKGGRPRKAKAAAAPAPVDPLEPPAA